MPGGSREFCEWPEDQTANLNRCLFFITPLISYAAPVLPRFVQNLGCCGYRQCCTRLHGCVRLVSTRFRPPCEFVTDSRLIGPVPPSLARRPPPTPPLLLPQDLLSSPNPAPSRSPSHSPPLNIAIRGCIQVTGTRVRASFRVYLLDQIYPRGGILLEGRETHAHGRVSAAIAPPTDLLLRVSRR